jgi:hypothetical protein
MLVNLHYIIQYVCYHDLHMLTNRANSLMISEYKLALQLFKAFNNLLPQSDWIQLNFDQQITTRLTHFRVNKNNRLILCINALTNRFFYLNGKISLAWLNLTFVQFKIQSKNNYYHSYLILCLKIRTFVKGT